MIRTGLPRLGSVRGECSGGDRTVHVRDDDAGNARGNRIPFAQTPKTACREFCGPQNAWSAA